MALKSKGFTEFGDSVPSYFEHGWVLSTLLLWKVVKKILPYV